MTTLSETGGSWRAGGRWEGGTLAGGVVDLRRSDPVVDVREAPTHMDAGVRVSVIVPTLNEADNVTQVLPAIPLWVDEVLLVDGGSGQRPSARAGGGEGPPEPGEAPGEAHRGRAVASRAPEVLGDALGPAPAAMQVVVDDLADGGKEQKAVEPLPRRRSLARQRDEPREPEEQILEQQGFGRRCIHEVDLAHREPSAGCRPDQGLRRTSRPFGDPPRGRVVPSGAWVGVGVHGSCGWETVRRRRTRARSSGRSSCIRTTRRGVEAGPTTA